MKHEKRGERRKGAVFVPIEVNYAQARARKKK